MYSICRLFTTKKVIQQLMRRELSSGNKFKKHFIQKKWKNRKIKPTDKVRWAIAPISLMGDDFATALSALPKENHQLVACAAPYKSCAKAFAEKHDVPKVYTSFYDLAKSKNIDVVYISPLHSQHLELSTLMMQHGKHVLCEKPLCTTEQQASELIGNSHLQGRFLMEAMWSRFLPSYDYIRKKIASLALGEVYEVDCTYGMVINSADRLSKTILGNGVTQDLGINPIQFSQWVFRIPPYHVIATGLLDKDGIDVEASIDLDYCCGRKAVIDISENDEFENVAIIKGTKGEIKVPEYWCPTKIIDVDGSEKLFPLPEIAKSTIFPKRIALCYQAEEVRRCLMNRKNQSDLMSHNETLLISKIVDQVRRQLGVEFPEEEDNLLIYEGRQ